MSTKKYLSLEEAAALLKLKSDELIRLREKGDVRGFADRGTWKFKSEDIEELKRRQQPDSNPEVPMISEVDDELGRQQTVITKGRGGASDSDVRLVPDDQMRSKLAGSSAEIPALADSDSDVRLSGEATQELPSDSDVKLVTPKMESDSDVKLLDTDSDVKISDSDSDVRLAPPLPSDSDVKLVERGAKKKRSSDSDVTLLPRGAKGGKPAGKETIDFDDASLTGSESVLLEDSGMALMSDSGIRLGGGSSIRLPGDSGIALTAPADSGILLEGAGESGFPLQGDSGMSEHSSDSDIAIDDESGVSLETDSGIQLGGEDSGIRLDADSGIRLTDAPRSGVKKGKPKDDLDSGVPLLLAKDDDANRTDVEVPMMMEDSSELATLNLPSSPVKKKGKGDTSVVLFEEDDDSGTGLDESSGSLGDDEEGFDLESSDDEDLEVAEDMLDEDDEEQLEVFDSDDSVFDESFVEGGSAVGIPAVSGRMHIVPEVEWGTGTMVLLASSTLALSLGVLMAVDLLRVIWSSGSGAVYEGELLGIFAGLFK